MKLMLGELLKLRSLSALIAVKYLYKIVLNMEKTSFNLNVNSVVVLPNGFVGETLTFVNPAINVNVTETM